MPGMELHQGQRVVVVTGASSGIGRAAARAFAERGDWIVLAARRIDELEQTLQQCGGSGRVVACDMADRTQVTALAESVRAVEGRCDVLVNNAGIGSARAFDGPEAMAALDEVMAVNFFGVAQATAELLDLLRASDRACIVNVSSVAGLFAVPDAAIYSASKFALNGFSESLHAALSVEGIRVCTLQPGPVPTEGWPHRKLVRRGMLGRLAYARVEAVARAIIRMADGRGPAVRVIPRHYRWALLARDLAPWALRAGMRASARAGSRFIENGLEGGR